MSSNYGKVITKLREKAGLTQKEVAQKVGVTVQTVSNWETGLRMPRLYPAQTFKLCEALGCELKDIVEGKE